MDDKEKLAMSLAIGMDNWSQMLTNNIISGTVNSIKKELSRLEEDLDQILYDLDQLNIGKAKSNIIFVMKSLKDLHVSVENDLQYFQSTAKKRTEASAEFTNGKILEAMKKAKKE